MYPINQLQPLVDMDQVPKLLQKRGSASYVLSTLPGHKGIKRVEIMGNNKGQQQRSDNAPPTVKQLKYH